MTLEKIRKNYDGVYRMWHGVPILVSWDKLEPKKPYESPRRHKLQEVPRNGW